MTTQTLSRCSGYLSTLAYRVYSSKSAASRQCAVSGPRLWIKPALLLGICSWLTCLVLFVFGDARAQHRALHRHGLHLHSQRHRDDGNREGVGGGGARVEGRIPNSLVSSVQHGYVIRNMRWEIWKGVNLTDERERERERENISMAQGFCPNVICLPCSLTWEALFIHYFIDSSFIM